MPERKQNIPNISSRNPCGAIPGWLCAAGVPLSQEKGDFHMLLFGIAALLGLAQPAIAQDRCQEAEATLPLGSDELTVRLRIYDGKQIAQGSILTLGGPDRPFLLLVGSDEPGAAAEWAQAYVYAASAPLITQADTLRIIAPDGQHWDWAPYITNLESRSGRPGAAAQFPLASAQQPNPALTHQLEAGGTFRFERRRGETVLAGGEVEVPAAALRTALHRQALAVAREKLKPCPPIMIPPASAP